MKREDSVVKKGTLIREWIILGLSFGLGGHVALGLILHDSSSGRWQDMGWNTFLIGCGIYMLIQTGRLVYLLVRSRRM